jgi:hypothetical protein
MGDKQRQAPVVVEIQLERSQARGPRQLLRARLRRFAPAAGGRSFGPSLGSCWIDQPRPQAGAWPAVRLLGMKAAIALFDHLTSIVCRPNSIIEAIICC